MEHLMDRKPYNIVRKATQEDVEYIVEVLAKKMLEREYERPELYNKEALLEITTLSIKQGCTIVIERDRELVGVVGGVVHPHPFNPSITVLSEAMWYVEEEHRSTRSVIKMLKTYIGLDVSDEKTFSLLPSSNISERNMNKLGFKKTEIGYLMR